MTCHERANLILWYAAGATEPAEAEELQRHLETGCMECAGRLAEARAMVAMLPLSLTPQSPPASVRQKIMAGLEPKPKALLIKPPAPAVPTWAQIALPSLIAACVAAAFTIFFAWRLNAGRDTGMEAQLTDARDTVAALKMVVESQQLKLNQMQIETAAWAANKDLRVVPLDATDQQPSAHARIFWDPDNHKWHLFATGLKEPATGKQYELWAIGTDGTKVPVGGFNPSSGGDAAMITTVPVSLTPAAAAVTDEPSTAAVTVPTGSFQLKGAVN